MATRRPSLALPGGSYDPQYFAQLIRALDNYFATLDNANVALSIPLPGSGWGLATGALWNENGTVKVVSSDSNQAYAAGIEIKTYVGSVTVTTT